ncbi:MAG: PA domain-containing protein, partial [Bacteroidota bacterium]
MKKLYFKAFIIALLPLMFVSFNAQAQDVLYHGKLKVSGANEIDWDIDAIVANFGRMTGGFSGDLVWVTDGVTAPTDLDTVSTLGQYGCEELVNGSDLDGNIAFIGRGACEFGVKLRNAETAGATDGIIANRAPIGLDIGTHTRGLIWMGAGAVGDSLLESTQGVFISFEDRLEIARLLEQGPVEVTFEQNWMYDAAAAYSYWTPIDNVKRLDDIQLIAANLDTVNLFDVEFTATITDPAGDVTVLTEMVDTFFAVEPFADSLAANTSGETQVIFDEGYMPMSLGEYTVVFTVATQSGDTPIDSESMSTSFQITEDTWGLDNGDIANDRGVGMMFEAFVAATGIYNVGSYYRTGDEATSAIAATFALANPGEMEPGHEFNVFLYNADSDGDNTLDNDQSGVVEETGVDIGAADIVAVGTYIIDGSETSNQLLTVQFEDAAVLDTNNIYLLMIESSGFQFNSFTPPAYTATGGQSYPDFGTAYQLGTLFEVDGFEYWNDVATVLPGFPHGGRHPLVRLHTDNFVNTKDIEVLDEAKFSVFPTISNTEVNVQFNLDRISDVVKLRITDINGRLIASRVERQVQDQTVTFNTSAYPAGAYFINMET